MKAEDSRAETLALFAELSALAPQIRLGQLMSHLSFLAEDEFSKPLADLEDAELRLVMQRHQQELAAREHVGV